MSDYLQNNSTLMGDLGVNALSKALAVSEVNASMGKIVAFPTAGACGILPGVILSIYEKKSTEQNRFEECFFLQLQALEW